MSMSLRDQLLAAGLINKKQANEAERQQQHKERQSAPPRKRANAPEARPAAPPARPPAVAAKSARDLELNRQHNAKAEKKARLAQIKQLIEQNRIPPAEGDESYNFVDGSKIRRIPANATIRQRLTRGEIVIVRHAGLYELIPKSIAARIRERDEQVFIFSGVEAEAGPVDDGYQAFKVPDDLIW